MVSVELLREVESILKSRSSYSEPIKQDEDLVRVVGGLCLLRGEYVLIIDSKVAMGDKIRTFAEALRHFDLNQIYIKPALRELLDKTPLLHVTWSPSKRKVKRGKSSLTFLCIFDRLDYPYRVGI
jgi:hypothetical protein